MKVIDIVNMKVNAKGDSVVILSWHSWIALVSCSLNICIVDIVFIINNNKTIIN